MALPVVDLSGRTAIVTGAGKGLGRAYALHLAECGAAVLVNNRRHPFDADAATSAAHTVAAIQARGGRAVANWSDVCDPDSGHAMVEQARAAFGGLDIVVANAGISAASSFLKQGMAEFRDIFDTGFFGNLHLAHAAWPHLSPECDVSGEVLVSGAGMVRRNGTGETDGVLLPFANIGNAVHALHDKAVHAYAGSNESFSSFVRELTHLKQGSTV